MAIATRPWTRADLERLPDDGNRYEVLHGRLLVTPQASVPHQDIARTLLIALQAYCTRHGLGSAFSPGAVPFGRSELQPDVEVVFNPPSPLPEKWEELPRPNLVIEIVSGSTSRRDKGIKRDAYLQWGIPEYWIVDRFKRAVTVIRPEQDERQVTDVVRWQPRADLAPLEIPLSEIFR